MRNFGFGSKTGCRLPGETPGLLRHPDTWSRLSIYTIAFGQGVAVNCVQLASAFSAIANGGILMRPRIVNAIVGSDGRVLRSYEARQERRVISRETASALTDILVKVVKSGTGRRAAISGYDVAGKTGTAQKIDEDGSYSHSRFVSSFVGYAPAGKPEITVLVAVDEPEGEPWQCYGGSVAGPVFAKIGARVLKYLGVPPAGTEKKRVAAPVLACRRPEIKDTANFVAIRGNDYYSGKGCSIKGSYVALQGSSDPVRAEIAMPDLSGMTMRQAVKALSPYRLAVVLEGSGVVVGQSPGPGTPISPGTRCRLTFAAAHLN